METYLGLIPKDLACGALWPQIAGLLAKSLPYGRGEYTLDDILAGIQTGEMFAIGAVVDRKVRFVATCTIQRYPRKTILYVQHGAGLRGSDCLPTLKEAARILGADWIETRCRISVGRIYRKLGFDIGYCVPILELTP